MCFKQFKLKVNLENCLSFEKKLIRSLSIHSSSSSRSLNNSLRFMAGVADRNSLDFHIKSLSLFLSVTLTAYDSAYHVSTSRLQVHFNLVDFLALDSSTIFPKS